VITKDLLTTFNVQTVAVPKIDGRARALAKLWQRKNPGIDASGEEKAFLDDPYIACRRASVTVTPLGTSSSSPTFAAILVVLPSLTQDLCLVCE
jgi:hypothetical protein